MMAPLAVAQLPSWHDVWASVRTLGFLTGVACSFIVLLICWIIEFSRRMRRKNKVLRVQQVDGGELVLTYKAIRTHVRLLLEREFSALALKGIEISGGASKTLRLHVIASEGVKLSDIRGKVCDRLARSFKNDLGLGDAIKGISVDVEEFRKAEELLQGAPAETAAPQEAVAPQQELVVPPLPPEDVTPLASTPQKQDGNNNINNINNNNGGKKHK
ncbi:MAG: hypothetical protein J6T46_10845 [Victivallales bacterium]|nr:hypothetical protein [Victivallales bacterium]